jgi:hypothetical protein
MNSLPAPEDFQTELSVVGTNLAFTLIAILVIMLTSTLFNQTVQENIDDIEGFTSRVFAPLVAVAALVSRPWHWLTQSRPRMAAFAGPVIVLGLTAFTYGFLDPGFGFNKDGLALCLSLILGIGVVTYVYGGGQVLLTQRGFGVPAVVRVYPIALAIAIVSVLLSRFADFQPGIVYGFVAAYALLASTEFDRRQNGHVVFFPAIALLAVSLIAWGLVSPLRDALAENGDSWWITVLEGAAVAIFVGAIEGLFFNMIPITFMDGKKLQQWSMPIWVAMSVITGFLFWHIILNQEREHVEAFQEGSVIMVLSLLAACLTISFVTWMYFRGRLYGWRGFPWRRTAQPEA